MITDFDQITKIKMDGYDSVDRQSEAQSRLEILRRSFLMLEHDINDDIIGLIK